MNGRKQAASDVSSVAVNMTARPGRLLLAWSFMLMLSLLSSTVE
uniref:Uncharacterized protein n=1 Tax=Utricularia reniformis TaxID=192314 RepID=A0A1Y0B4I0_9LAMI|nr:hypothetical protein AEK19_MT2150 [Utricularia reniformis]ART32300.1 hypothetical protein AEK19_MT2150 [Utricularia reniformis]